MNQRCVRAIVLIVLGVVWVGLAVTWGQQPKPGGTLRVAFEADVTGLDPAIPGLQNYYVNQNLFNTLVTLDENLEFVPDLAASWDIQEQGKILSLPSASRRQIPRWHRLRCRRSQVES